MPQTGESASRANACAVARVLVTRPAHDAERWVQQLQQSGFAAEALPLIEIAPACAAPAVAALRQTWQTLDRYAACLFVSGNAVDYFFEQNPPVTPCLKAQSAINIVADGARRAIPSSLRFMAPGPATAAALVARGISALQIDAPPADALQFDSAALWQVIGQRDWRGCRVLVVRGQRQGVQSDSAGSTGRDWITRQWQAAGAEVDFINVYERRVPSLTVDQLGRARVASADGSVWLFSSSEAVANLTLLCSEGGFPALDWSQARAVATHPRIAETVRAAGWGVVVESRPALNDILGGLRSIESGYT